MAIEYAKEGSLAIFTISRPEAHNALNMAVTRELHKAMIDFRLKKAGMDDNRQRFSEDAFQEIYLVTRGYPRRVTNLCHNCIIEMFRNDKMVVDRDIVDYVISTEVPIGGREKP